MTSPTISEERLFLLYDICETKEELQEHIRTFLNIDLPNCTVDQDSTSNPMQFVWDIYECMKTGKGALRHVVAANRNGAKTLCACIVRFYGLIHFRRSGTHLAATMDQSTSAVKYLDKFLAIPGVAEYVTITNTRNKKLENLPLNGFTRNNSCEMRVVVATKKGVNSARSSLSMKDETDLLPPEIISESGYILDPTQDEHSFPPIEIDLSSRKSNDGPMQDKIDEAEGKDPPEDLKLHKWSLSDWMQYCPPEVHKPELGTRAAWVNSENLKATWGMEEYEALSPAEKSLQMPVNAFEGCKTCPAFIVCQGRAVKQTANTPMLRNVQFVNTILKAVKDPDSIISQALNLKPSSSSRVFKMFKKRMHFLQHDAVYEFITGYKPEFPITTTEQIYKVLSDNGWIVHYGVDWGYRPASATCIVGAYQRKTGKVVFLHVESSHDMPDPDWAEYISKQIWPRFPGDWVCPDMAQIASPAYFAKYGISARSSKPARIETGVAQLRSMLYDVTTEGTRLVILDDGEYGQNHMLCEAFEKWTHLKTASGFNFDKFEDNDFCDFLDPSRYLLDPFVQEQVVSISSSQTANPHTMIHPQMTEADKQVIRDQSQMKASIQNHFLNQYGVDPTAKPEEKKNKKQGSIKFKF